jgi:Kdo2-lipid IVA lauroyltransferase/acyltransferase
LIYYLSRYIIRYRFTVVETNLRHTRLYSHNTVNSFYKTFATTLAEIIIGSFSSNQAIAENIKYDLNDLEAISSSLNRGRKILILASHFYNWEWAGMVLPCYLDVPCTAVYKPLSNRMINLLVMKQRKRMGMKMVAMGDVIRSLMKEEGADVYLMISDQSPSLKSESIDIAFLEKNTSFYQGMNKISRRFEMEVYVQRINKSNGKYFVKHTKISENEDVLTAYVDILQRDIIKDPSAWLWTHKRWKRQNIYK